MLPGKGGEVGGRGGGEGAGGGGGGKRENSQSTLCLKNNIQPEKL